MRNKLIAIVLVNVIVNVCLAQETKKNVEKQDMYPTPQLDIQPVTMSMTMGAPINDFYAAYKMEKQMKISSYATKINWGSAYLVKWDGGGIRGFGGGRGIYQGRYAGFDIGGSKGGVQLGVQRGYNPLTGQWEVMPMATPYINIGGVPVGFDVGGMAYSLIREAFIRDHAVYGNPNSGIIAPPIEVKVGFDSSPEIPAWIEKQFEKQ